MSPILERSLLLVYSAWNLEPLAHLISEHINYLHYRNINPLFQIKAIVFIFIFFCVRLSSRFLKVGKNSTGVFVLKVVSSEVWTISILPSPGKMGVWEAQNNVSLKTWTLPGCTVISSIPNWAFKGNHLTFFSIQFFCQKALQYLIIRSKPVCATL